MRSSNIRAAARCRPLHSGSRATSKQITLLTAAPNRALYAYALEDYAWWEAELQQTLSPGTFGENLTTFGFDPNDALVGERWAVGSTLLEVSQPRLPCFKLAARLALPSFVRRFAEGRRPGSYLRIVGHGKLASGDAIDLDFRPAHHVSIRELFRIYLDNSVDPSPLLAVPQLSTAWHEWAELAVHKRTRGRDDGAP